VNSLKQIIKKIDILKIAEVLAVVVILAIPFVSLAALGDTFRCDPSTGMRCQETSINQLIMTVIRWLLGIAFGVAVLFLIIGGFWYIASAGNEETAEKGKNTAVNAIIGIVIIILSYVIVNVVSRMVAGEGNQGP
jgi:amino acid transporter